MGILFFALWHNQRKKGGNTHVYRAVAFAPTPMRGNNVICPKGTKDVRCGMRWRRDSSRSPAVLSEQKGVIAWALNTFSPAAGAARNTDSMKAADSFSTCCTATAAGRKKASLSAMQTSTENEGGIHVPAGAGARSRSTRRRGARSAVPRNTQAWTAGRWVATTDTGVKGPAMCLHNKGEPK